MIGFEISMSLKFAIYKMWGTRYLEIDAIWVESTDICEEVFAIDGSRKISGSLFDLKSKPTSQHSFFA